MARRGERLQAEVLAVLHRRGGPRSACDVFGELREVHPGIAPPTICRAMAALTEHGRVHRLESPDAFIPCQCDRHQHASILSICDDYGTVEENTAPDLLQQLSSIVGKSGFAPVRHVIEVHGVCGSCGGGQAHA
ncbi:MAG: transcriptional repressor [Geminicoccaceae bacterium]|nr:transcriptional repressor [Geminicoccaceae bacterium]